MLLAVIYKIPTAVALGVVAGTRAFRSLLAAPAAVTQTGENQRDAPSSSPSRRQRLTVRNRRSDNARRFRQREGGSTVSTPAKITGATARRQISFDRCVAIRAAVVTER